MLCGTFPEPERCHSVPPPQLAEAQQQLKELNWQIKVAFGGAGAGLGGAGRGGGAAGGAGSRGVSGMLDILGCGANFRRQ